MKITKTFPVEASADHVWSILGADYTRVSTWASSVYASRPREGTPVAKEAPALGRVCQTSIGPFTETIERYDDQNRQMTYAATGEKMPGFVRSLKNSWDVRPMGAGRAQVSMELYADIAFPFNILMGPIMKRQFNTVLKNVGEELAHFAETGKPHPRTVKIDGSKKAVHARASFA